MHRFFEIRRRRVPTDGKDLICLNTKKAVKNSTFHGFLSDRRDQIRTDDFLLLLQRHCLRLPA